MKFYGLSATVALVVVVIMVELLRRGQLREKYAAMWLVIGSTITVTGLVPRLLFPLSRLLGVQTPSNLVFFLAALVLLGVCLHLSWEVSRLEDETRRLAEEQALLRLQVETLMTARSDPPQ